MGRRRCLHVVARDIWRGDAVGNFALGMARLAAERGVEARLYAENHAPHMPIRPPEDLPGAVEPHDVVMFSASTFDPALELVLGLGCRKVAYFHNITPPGFFRPWDPAAAGVVEQAHAQLPAMAGFDALFANSRVTARLLAAHLPDGHPAAGVFPPVLGLEERWAVPPAAPPAEWGRGPYLLSVGRIAPHKGVLELLALFRALAEREPGLRLIVAGTPACPAYFQAVRDAAAGLPGRVVLTGPVDDGVLLSLYRGATALINLSAHEGFGVPVLEALRFGLPLFLSPDPAMAEVAGDTAHVLAGDDWRGLAESVLTALPALSTPEAAARRRARHRMLAGQCDGRILPAVLGEG